MNSYINLLIRWRFYGDMPLLAVMIHDGFDMIMYSPSMAEFSKEEYEIEGLFVDEDLEFIKDLMENNA